MTSSDASPTAGRIAQFYERSACIACGSRDLRTLDQGRFDRPPHKTVYESSPWGESPLPYLEGCTWELVRCARCQQVFHKRTLTEEWDAVRFERWMTKEAMAEFERRLGASSPAAIFRKLKRELEWVLIVEKMSRELRGDRAVRWLDFGCGWGRVVELARLSGFEAYGVDRSSARRDGTTAASHIYESLDALRNDVSQPFHVASMYEVLEHVHDPLSTLKALRQCLVPGGLLIIEVPDGTGFDDITRTGSLDIADGLDHVNAFDPKTLTRIVERAGFERVRERPTPQVTADWKAAMKRETRRLVGRFMRETTSQIFKKTGA